MSYSILAAGVLMCLIGIIHSFLGERLIFQLVRKDKIVPTQAPEPLRERHLRILWATWHLPSVFGFCLGVLLIYLGLDIALLQTTVGRLAVAVIGTIMLISAALVAYATNARHPGWVGMGLVAILCLVG